MLVLFALGLVGLFALAVANAPYSIAGDAGLSPSAARWSAVLGMVGGFTLFAVWMIWPLWRDGRKADGEDTRDTTTGSPEPTSPSVWTARSKPGDRFDSPQTR
jgi:hypothetical protein